MRRISVSFTLGVILLLSLAVPALAAKPTIVKDSFDEPFTDPFLSQVCGFDVTGTVSGHTVSRLWTDADGNLVREVFTISVRGSLSAGGQTLHFVDTGLDKAIALDGGAVMVVIHGNVRLITAPGAGPVLGSAGRLAFVVTPVLDENGDPVLDEFGEPVFDFEVVAESGLVVENFDALCAALAPPA